MIKNNFLLFMLYISFSSSLLYAGTDGLSYLNQLRNAVGMNAFSANDKLDQAALNHANYLVLNNVTGHYEVEGNPGFSGVSPPIRVGYTYYKASASENVFSGDTDINTSIDQLFSAIYHRFGFLTFDKDEIGIGVSSAPAYDFISAYVYNMANSGINTLCGKQTSTSGYNNVCADAAFIVPVNDYWTEININRSVNPLMVVWPYEDQSDSMTVFFEEAPDPLPECSVTGYPVSVQSNEYYNSGGNMMTMKSFKLYDEDNNEITNTTIMEQETDPHNQFTSYQFALFPLERLKWDSYYRAEFIYTQDNTEKTKEWSFKTRSPIHPYYQIETNFQTIRVVSGKPYVIYIPPENCNDTFDDVEGSFDQDNGLVIDKLESIDKNSFAVQISGPANHVLTVDVNNGSNTRIYLQITNPVSTIVNTLLLL